MHLTAVCSRKMLNFLHYNQRGKCLLMQRDRSPKAVRMWHWIQGTQVQAGSSNSRKRHFHGFSIFLCPPFRLLLCLKMTFFFHILILSDFCGFYRHNALPGIKSPEIRNFKHLCENGKLNTILVEYMSPVKRICAFEHSVMTNFNCACPAIQSGQESGFLSEGSSWLTACMSEQRRFWRDCADAQARLNLRCSHRR